MRELKELFEKYGVIKIGHFKLTSGKHSNQYINKDAIYCIPDLYYLVTRKMHSNILNNVPYDSYDVITGPAIAGSILAAPIALKSNKIFVYPEKIDEKMLFRRGYDKILKDKRVWIIEDIITTGRSIEKTIDAVEKCRGHVVGISAIWNRGQYKIAGIPFLSLINEAVISYWPDECPNCKAGDSLQNPKD